MNIWLYRVKKAFDTELKAYNKNILEKENIKMTYVYTQLSTNDIAHALYQDDYASWHKNMTACDALAEHIENLAIDMGKPIELDTVAIRCDYSLMDDIEDYNKQYNTEYESMDDITETTVIRVDDDSFIIMDY